MRISIVLSSLLIASQAYAIKYPTGKLQQPVVTKSVAAPIKAVAPVMPKATPVAKVKTVTTTKTTTTISKSDTIKKTVVKTIISSKKTEAVAPKKIVIEKKITKIIDEKATAKTTTQQLLTPEMLWGLKRVGAVGVNANTQQVYFDTRSIDIKTEKGTTRHCQVDVNTGRVTTIQVPADFEKIFLW